MAKKLSNFGKAMKMLDISILEIAQLLYIDKTTVSKWRSGSRKLLKRSPYFDSIVTIMMEREMASDDHPFASLWAKTNASEAFSEEVLKEYIASFLLVNDSVENDVLLASLEEDGTIPQYKCFVGVEGRKKAVDHILQVAEKMNAPTHIKILELEQMDWLCRDMVYMRNVMKRLERLALNGTQIDIVFSTANSTSAFRTFLLRLESVRYLKSVRIHFLNADRINDLIPCVYGIPDYCVAVGMDSAEASVPIHTNLYSDYLNAHKYSLFFDKVIKVFGMTALVSDHNSHIDDILKAIAKTYDFKQDIVFFSDYLSVTAMEEELLVEILNHNNVDTIQKERCLAYYRTLKNSVLRLPSSYYMTYYTNLQALEEALGFESSYEFELSAICGKPIHKTKAQLQKHIQQFVKFLQDNENLRVVIRYGGHSRLRSYSWLKMKLWEFSLNIQINPNEYQMGFVDDEHLVTLIEEICEHSLKRHPLKHSIKQYNIEVLQALIVE